MEIILLERVGKLGAMGDVVNVKDGYARNFLLPQGKALRANKANMAVFEARREELEKNNTEMKLRAEDAAKVVDGKSYVVIRSAGEAGQLYGSVSTRDIAGLVSADGADVSRNNIIMPQPIKMLGIHEVEVALHADVSATVTLNVARSEDEAERQARGENIFATDEDEEEGAISPEEVFEDEAVAAEAAAELSEAEETGESPAAEEAATDEEASAATAEAAAEPGEAEETGDGPAAEEAATDEEAPAATAEAAAEPGEAEETGDDPAAEEAATDEEAPASDEKEAASEDENGPKED